MIECRPYLVKLLIATVVLLAGCKPQVPSDVIQPDDMEDILYDLSISQNLTDKANHVDNDYRLKYNQTLVFDKYSVTEAEFDSSLVYYYNHLEDLYKIYEKVKERLGDEALELGASTVEVEQYFTNSLTGDTAEIWGGKRHHILLPQAPYNVIQFTQKADTACHQGDSYALTFNNSFLVQSGSRQVVALLSVRYENDSIISQHINVPAMGIGRVNIPICNLKAKEFKGFFYMPRRTGQDNDADMCMYMADHIQLFRYHHDKDKVTEEAKPDTAETRTAVATTVPDTANQRKIHKLGERPMPLKPIKPITKKQ